MIDQDEAENREEKLVESIPLEAKDVVEEKIVDASREVERSNDEEESEAGYLYTIQ